MPDTEGVDLSGIHREIDRLKSQLCRCNHHGDCLACRGFEMLRQQAQMVIAAASQPVLLQVAQEASLKDLMSQMGGLQEKLLGDPRLQELLGQLMERVQDDLGGADALEKLFGGLAGMAGAGGPQAAEDHPRGPIPYDDRPSPPGGAPPGEERPRGAGDDGAPGGGGAA